MCHGLCYAGAVRNVSKVLHLGRKVCANGIDVVHLGRKECAMGVVVHLDRN